MTSRWNPLGLPTAQHCAANFCAGNPDARFDRVEDVFDQIELVAGRDDRNREANYELRIPLSLLHLKLEPGCKLKGDIGVLRGQNGATVARVYWSNKATAIVSDVPSEAALAPQNWGVIEAR